MRECKFHHELYSLRALERCREVYRSAAEVEVAQEMPYFRVTVQATEPAVEAEVLGELMNYALALTVEEKRSRDGDGRE